MDSFSIYEISYREIIVIGLILIITFYILYQMYKKRRYLREKLKEVEGFTVIPVANRPITIQNIASSRANYSLFEYCIKASYNSAYDGSNMTLLALDDVISRGCRFMDFEIYLVDESPCVGYSTDSTFSTLTSGNTLLLKDVFHEIVGNCFTGNCPNPRDPLFVHLRINTTCGLSNSSSCEIYQQVAAIIQSTLLPRLYVDKNKKAIPVLQTTKLADMAGKIVLVMDASVNRDYKNYSVCDSTNTTNTKCYDLTQYINIESGGTQWKMYKFSDFLNRTQNPLIVDSKDPAIAEPSNGSLSLQLVLPDRGVNVQNASFPLSNISSYGCQTVAMKFYKRDKALKDYEALFNEYKTAFVPLGTAVNYIDKH